MKKITPFLWYDGNVQEVADFYLSVFKNGQQTSSMPGPGGLPMSVSLTLEGQDLVAFNGGPMFKFNESVSFFINCETQEEVDYYWNKLTAEGTESRCGWLKDKYGLSWQVVPNTLGGFLGNADRVKANRAMQAMLQMNKLDMAALQKAFDGE